MPKPVCVPCQRFFRPMKNGFRVVEAKPTHNDALPGKNDSESWVPYKLWMGDKWICQGCRTEIVVGFGVRPIAEEHHPYFELECKTAKLQVNDC